MTTTKSIIPGVLAMALVVVASNVLVQFLLLDGLLTWGAFTYPFAFLVTDVMNRIYGVKAARKVVFVGFLTGVACSLIGSQIMLEFGPAVPMRIAVASGLAFLTAQLMDVAIFDRLRAGAWWRAPLASTIIGSTVDSVIFFTVAFAGFISFGAVYDFQTAWAKDLMPFLGFGPNTPVWVSLGIMDWVVKLTVALAALVPFRVVTQRWKLA